MLCQDAINLIISCEVTDRRTYEARYAKPTWPGGESGVTIGVGYDLGYNNRAALDRDWACLPTATRDLLAIGLGKTGDAAKLLAPSLYDVVVPWEAAVAAFREHTLPRYERQALDAFPGADQLPPECFGALVSLVFNRGTSMTGDRRVEMRDIRDAIKAGRLEAVPELLRAMKRLWPSAGGLRDRRDREAALWELGLARRPVQPAIA